MSTDVKDRKIQQLPSTYGANLDHNNLIQTPNNPEDPNFKKGKSYMEKKLKRGEGGNLGDVFAEHAKKCIDNKDSYSCGILSALNLNKLLQSNQGKK